MNSLRTANLDGLSFRRVSIHDPVVVLRGEQGDLLGRERIAALILDRLQDDTCPPALGLYGSWGTGKTSVLNFLYLLNLESSVEVEKKKLHITKIDAWQYEATGNLFIPVISRLKKLAGKELEKTEGIVEDAKHVLRVTALTLLNVGFSKVGLSTSDIQKYYEENLDDPTILGWEKLNNDVERTQLALSKIIDAAIRGQEIDRLVICIDNLDRCSPDNAIHLLDSIKNFVDDNKCIWLFSMDADIIAKYLDSRYEDITMYGNSYLDKIVPEQYHLSLSPTKDFSKIRELLRFSTGENALENIPLRRNKLPEIPRVLVPRRLIKSAHKFSEYYKEPPRGGASPDTVFALVLLYHGWPEFYERLSFTSDEHIRGILSNFLPEKNSDETMPLNKNITEDQELIYFLRRVLLNDDAIITEGKIDEIMCGIDGLRRTGLP